MIAAADAGPALYTERHPYMRYDTVMSRVPASQLFFLAVLCALPVRAARTLELYFIDVEGGQATLVVAPSGQSLLIDAGSSGFNGRDSGRILSAAKDAGIKHIDYLLITDFQPDHVGGVPNLLQRLPVMTFLDSGKSIDYPTEYSASLAKGKHSMVAAGDQIPLKDLDVTLVAAAGKVLDRRGATNPYCAGVQTRSGENTESTGVVIQFGKFRFADLGDLNWNQELSLLCPANRAGKIDLYLTTRSGGESSSAIWAMAPRVAIMNNGPRKGGNPAGWKNVMASPGLEDMWQLHFALANGKEANAPDTLIANLNENCEGKALKVSATADGAFTVMNTRNKFSRSYAAR